MNAKDTSTRTTWLTTRLSCMLVVVLLVGCEGSSAQTSPPAGASASPTDAPESQPSAGTARPTPSSTYGPFSTQLQEQHWERIGKIDGYASTVVAFEDGYMVVGNFPGFELDRPGSAWFSPDGTIWEAIELGGMTGFCAGYEGGPVSRAQVTSGGSSGTQIILTGTELTADRCYDLAAPGPERTVSWLSTDGRHWVRSSGSAFGDSSYPEYVWATPGGWEAAVHKGLWGADGGTNQSTAVWRSADGLTWSKTSFAVPGTNMDFATASGAGLRLLTYSLGDQHLIMTSSDGEAWRRLDGALVEDFITHVVPPVGGESSSWLLLAGSGETTVWTSSDLEQWSATVIASDRLISTAIATSHGYLVSADPACQGDLCGREPQSQFVSPDGLHWTTLTPSIEGAMLLVRGPAGVLAIGREDGTVWRLGA